VPLLPIPQPYDFVLSTERFRAFGLDRAAVWHGGGLHRVVGGREVRIEAARGGVLVEPLDEQIERHVGHLLGLPYDLAGFWTWARREPALASLAPSLAGYRPVLQPDPWEMVVTSITAQQVSLQSAFAIRSRLVARFGERADVAWAFPGRERLARVREEELVALGFSRRKAAYVVGLARSELDLDGLTALADEDVVAALTATRGLGRWSADWFLARCLARPAAWPAGDLGLRKAVSRFYGGGKEMSEVEVRAIGERLGANANLAAHALLLGARIAG
jgi:DNA-3-methyladenine glycosylase II